MAGELLTAPLQLQLRGLLMGRGTPFPIDSIEGLGVPAMRTQDQDLADDDGAEPTGPDLLEPRQLLVSLGVYADTAAELRQLLDDLVVAWAPMRAGTLEAALWIHGWPAQLIRVRPRRAPLTQAFWESHGQTQLVGELWMPDPYLYALEEETVDVQLAIGATSATVAEAVAGTGRTRPVVTITGPARDPVLTIDPPDAPARALRFDVDLQAGETLVADVAAKRIEIDGVDAFAARAADLQWPELRPGANDLTYSRAADALTGAASTATVDYRPARMG